MLKHIVSCPTTCILAREQTLALYCSTVAGSGSSREPCFRPLLICIIIHESNTEFIRGGRLTGVPTMLERLKQKLASLLSPFNNNNDISRTDSRLRALSQPLADISPARWSSGNDVSARGEVRGPSRISPRWLAFWLGGWLRWPPLLPCDDPCVMNPDLRAERCHARAVCRHGARPGRQRLGHRPRL